MCSEQTSKGRGDEYEELHNNVMEHVEHSRLFYTVQDVRSTLPALPQIQQKEKLSNPLEE